MKIILSRKGFDSQNGGIPSPIICDGNNYHVFSIPIPYEYGISYQDILFYKKKTAYDLLTDLTQCISFNNQKKMVDKNLKCHFDPDIVKKYIKNRNKNWVPAFGQVNQSQAHLSNNGIGKNDLFLFFGWFKFAEFVNGRFQYSKEKNKAYPNGFHAIFGYLQVREKIEINNVNIDNSIKDHVHVKFPIQDKLNNNSVYIANKYFNGNHNIEGSGLIKFNNDCILSKEGKNRATWKLPKYFHPDNNVELSYHSKDKWNYTEDKQNVELNSARKGQEFIFTKMNDQIEKWSINLITNNSIGSS